MRDLLLHILNIATYTQNFQTNNTILFQFGSLSRIYVQKYEHLNWDVKMGQFIYQSRKNGGLIVYLAALKKGAFRAAHPYQVIYRELSPTPEIRAYSFYISKFL